MTLWGIQENVFWTFEWLSDIYHVQEMSPIRNYTGHPFLKIHQLLFKVISVISSDDTFTVKLTIGIYFQVRYICRSTQRNPTVFSRSGNKRCRQRGIFCFKYDFLCDLPFQFQLDLCLVLIVHIIPVNLTVRRHACVC